MKNIINAFILFVIIGLLLMILILSKKSDKDIEYHQNPTNPIYDVSSFNQIKPTDIENFKKNKLYVIFIGRENCVYSRSMLAIYKLAQEEYDYVTQYINILDIYDYANSSIIDKSEYDYLNNLDRVKSEENFMKSFSYTPLTLFVKNKKIVKTYLGEADYETFSGILEDLGLKKK